MYQFKFLEIKQVTAIYEKLSATKKTRVLDKAQRMEKLAITSRKKSE